MTESQKDCIKALTKNKGVSVVLDSFWGTRSTALQAWLDEKRISPGISDEAGLYDAVGAQAPVGT